MDQLLINCDIYLACALKKTLPDAVYVTICRRLDDYVILTSARCLDKRNSYPFSQQHDIASGAESANSGRTLQTQMPTVFSLEVLSRFGSPVQRHIAF
ncbi:hypothetical protein CY34DRAFT_739003 [Suillus luteus UH-Slu-Lm8-n1]|uniref:Uncharacterized protein n=1 Tax=Suillus luteus UH-Slu-Lm8-n1 TaxID=930992 RepID=A0A0C9Z6D8_9AGAM|nr:hypothetical protein CY34DRAFT_739003 [Suillus luteus UH-Slu-Lm8-n1]